MLTFNETPPPQKKKKKKKKKKEGLLKPTFSSFSTMFSSYDSRTNTFKKHHVQV